MSAERKREFLGTAMMGAKVESCPGMAWEMLLTLPAFQKDSLASAEKAWIAKGLTPV